MKKGYEPPALTTVGTVSELTEGELTGTEPDGPFHLTTPPPNVSPVA
jgi:hypothetical protein